VKLKGRSREKGVSDLLLKLRM